MLHWITFDRYAFARHFYHLIGAKPPNQEIG